MTINAVVFDAYGTLYDIQSVAAVTEDAFPGYGDIITQIWRIKQLEYSWTLTLAGRYENFWTLTERALDFALARFPSVDRALKPALMDAYRALDAFADAGTILRSIIFLKSVKYTYSLQ